MGKVERLRGTVRRLLRDKGFGFIAAGDGTEYFFYRTALTRARFEDLSEGVGVEFTPQMAQKGWRAEDVELL